MIPTSYIQARQMSNKAHYLDRVGNLSQQVLQKIRLATLPTIEHLGPSIGILQSPFLALQTKRIVDEVLREAQAQPEIETELRDYFVRDATFTIAADDKNLSRWIEDANAWSQIYFEQGQGARRVEVSPKSRTSSCFRYAFKNTGTPIAEPINSSSQILSLLEQYEYKPVSYPQEKDLVLFLKAGQPVHLGIYENGKIRSKEGNASPVAFTKPLEDFSAEYGEQIVYFSRYSRLNEQIPLFPRRIDQLNNTFAG